MGKRKIGQFGNFVVIHDDKKGFVSVRAVVGFWELRWRNDHPMFGALMRFIGDNEMKAYFEHVFSVWYMLSQGFPDGKCLEGLVALCDEWYKRLGDGIKEDEDELAVLANEVAKEDLEKEVENVGS